MWGLKEREEQGWSPHICPEHLQGWGCVLWTQTVGFEGGVHSEQPLDICLQMVVKELHMRRGVQTGDVNTITSACGDT